MLNIINDGVLESRVYTKMGRKAWLKRRPGWNRKDIDNMLQKFFKESGLDPREVYVWILFSPVGTVDKYVSEMLGL